MLKLLLSVLGVLVNKYVVLVVDSCRLDELVGKTLGFNAHFQLGRSFLLFRPLTSLYDEGDEALVTDWHEELHKALIAEGVVTAESSEGSVRWE